MYIRNLHYVLYTADSKRKDRTRMQLVAVAAAYSIASALHSNLLAPLLALALE